MKADILAQADRDLELAFEHYEDIRPGLGVEMMDEFRRALELIIRFPGAWQQLDDVHRRCRLRRFPYGIIYRRAGVAEQVIVVVAVMHLARHADRWRGR